MSKRWKKILLFVGLPILVAGAVYWFAWAGTTKPIETVADQFKVPSSWKLVKDEAKAPGLCIAETCPRLQKTWETTNHLTQAQLIEIVKNSGWSQVAVEDDCDFDVCRMFGKVASYDIKVSVSSSNSSDPPTLSLYIK